MSDGSNVLDLTSKLAASKATLSRGTRQPPDPDEDDIEMEESDAYMEETEIMVQGWIDDILEDMEELGVSDESAEFSRDFIFCTEALRSLVYRSRGLSHFIQEVADVMIEVEFDEPDTVEGFWKFESDNPPTGVDEQRELLLEQQEKILSQRELIAKLNGMDNPLDEE